MPRKSKTPTTTTTAAKADPKRAAFLAAYAKSGNIATAAKCAKLARSSHYEWLAADPAYAAAFAEAKVEAVELLEAEARRRAVTGIQEPVIYQGELSMRRSYDPETGEMTSTDEPLTVRKYSDVLLIFLLKGAAPEKYRENVHVQHGADPKILELLAEGRARVAAMGASTPSDASGTESHD